MFPEVFVGGVPLFNGDTTTKAVRVTTATKRLPVPVIEDDISLWQRLHCVAEGKGQC